MMYSMAPSLAEYLPSWYRHKYVSNKRMGWTRDEKWRKLQAFLDSFAIVGTTERLDETLLLAHDLTGLPLLEYRRNRPGPKWDYNKTDAQICPDMESCRWAVQRHAGRDHAMYALYKERFEARLEDLGPSFASRVQQYKAALQRVQPLWKRASSKQIQCNYRAEVNLREPSLSDANTRCPIGADGVGERHEEEKRLCQTVYAYRLWDCPWQYVPDSLLTDSVGCFRS